MRRLFWFGAICLGLAFAGPSDGANKKKAPGDTGVASSSTGNVVSADKAEKNATKLVDQLNWHSDLAAAQSQARKENKPILWLHVLGEIDGVC